MRIRTVALWLTVLLLLSGCAVFASQQFDQRFGSPSPQARFKTPNHPAAQIYENHVKPVLEQRCVVCHACYDAPCQLKLSSPEGIERGISPRKVYNGTRLLADPPTRLFQDASSTEGWREKGFTAVLNERSPDPEANLEGSLLYRSLRLKQQHPNPATPLLPDSIELGLSRNQQCAPVEQYDRIEQAFPLWGMPYGLPGLNAQEMATLSAWLSQGAMLPNAKVPSATTQAQVDHWEDFFNRNGAKARLVSRYIYEHLYLFDLYFEHLPGAPYFKLVRSSTPPGVPIKQIATRRPFDDPGVKRVFYRLQPQRASIVAKNHIPYALGAARQARWQVLFFGNDYSVEQLPGYAPEHANNPFITFAALPPKARYRFMLDEAQATIMAFIKGPVCRGQLAVNVINEHFWVYFINPEIPLGEASSKLLGQSLHQLAIPNGDSNTFLPLSTWLKYAGRQADYLETKTRLFNQEVESGIELSEQLVWDGNQRNPNAALTVFRHFDNASVVQGLVGQTPKTAWIIDYPLLERIHYLLVAGFDVYGNLGHQLVTRLYMDFLRMEGEFNFLALLPASARQREREYWYRDSGPGVRSYVFGRHAKLHQEPAIDYRTDTPKLELFQHLNRHLGKALTTGYALSHSDLSPTTITLLERLQALHGGGIALLPENTLMLVRTNAGTEQLFSLIHHRSHANITSLFDEQSTLRPDEDTLTITYGVVGDHPNALLNVDEAQLTELANRLAGLHSESDYRAFMGRYGVRRTDPDFWPVSDRIHGLYRAAAPLEAGILDYNRLENR